MLGETSIARILQQHTGDRITYIAKMVTKQAARAPALERVARLVPRWLHGLVLPDAQYIYKAVAKVLLSQSGDTSTLDLVLTYNSKVRTFVFILRYAHRENIRRLEFNKPHKWEIW